MANEQRLIDANDLWQKTFVCEEPGDFRQAIENAPTVDAVEVVHGRWIYKWDADRDPKKLFVRIVCSECNLHTGQKSNYCPNCGAKMDGGNEDSV